MGPRQETFCMLALYNRWANRQLYGAAAQCATEQLRDTRAGTSLSPLGTLNYLLASDRMWLRRLEGGGPGAVSPDIIYEDLPDLAEARAYQDQCIAEFTYSLSEDKIAAQFTYQTTPAKSQTQPLHVLLSHLFNHQAHHRALAHYLVSQALVEPIEAPVLDLLHYQHTVASADAL
jgi:uncharacterized damage-inducible protein DinB